MSVAVLLQPCCAGVISWRQKRVLCATTPDLRVAGLRTASLRAASLRVFKVQHDGLAAEGEQCALLLVFEVRSALLVSEVRAWDMRRGFS